MRIFELIPNKKVGLLEFGMKRSQVRKILGEYVEFKKTKASKNTTDDFSDCHAYYDQENLLKALEIFNDAQLKYNNQNVFELNLIALNNFLVTLDSSLVLNSDGLESTVLGLNVNAPNGVVESVLVYGNNYYNNK